jgi:hypothetical protein
MESKHEILTGACSPENCRLPLEVNVNVKQTTDIAVYDKFMSNRHDDNIKPTFPKNCDANFINILQPVWVKR